MRAGRRLRHFRINRAEGSYLRKRQRRCGTSWRAWFQSDPGKNAYIEGYSIGGKTATSQTLPRSANKYISSFIGFAPAENPQILGMCVIYDPKGIYYGGTIAAPVVREIFDDVLPYLGIEKQENAKSEKEE